MQGKALDWANILKKKTHRLLMTWTTSQFKVMMGRVKVDPKFKGL